VDGLVLKVYVVFNWPTLECRLYWVSDP